MDVKTASPRSCNLNTYNLLSSICLACVDMLLNLVHVRYCRAASLGRPSRVGEGTHRSSADKKQRTGYGGLD